MFYKITVPKPCHEDWQAMTATKKGAFCKSCAKEVIDFTTTSKRELTKKVRNGNSLCGRFKLEQLNTPLPAVSQSQFRKRAALLGFSSLLALGSPAFAQEVKKPPIEIIENEMILGEISIVPPEDTYVTLKGNIKDLDNMPLPGALVSLRGTQVKTQSDFDGNFSLSILRSLLEEPEMLIIQSLGFENLEIPVTYNTDFIQAEFTEKEVYVLGGYAIKRPNVFHRFLNLFRK